ncbi:MAG TPA: PadR family transcriptional regulator [Acidimicrobiales bacterium]
MLELAILGLLKEQDLHGYELKKRLAETLGLGSGVSFGSLYPALGRLERAGAVKAVEAHQSGSMIPMTGSLGGEPAAFRARKSASPRPRGKKVYGITDRGEALFDELLAAGSGSSDDDRGFNLRLAFARYLPPDARIGMLERRRSYLLERLARTSSAIRTGLGRFDAYTKSVIEHGNETTERDISWIDRMIAHERATATSPGSPADPLAPAVPRDWAVSTAPTMPVPPADLQGGIAP